MIIFTLLHGWGRRQDTSKIIKMSCKMPKMPTWRIVHSNIKPFQLYKHHLSESNPPNWRSPWLTQPSFVDTATANLQAPVFGGRSIPSHSIQIVQGMQRRGDIFHFLPELLISNMVCFFPGNSQVNEPKKNLWKAVKPLRFPSSNA